MGSTSAAENTDTSTAENTDKPIEIEVNAMTETDDVNNDEDPGKKEEDETISCLDKIQRQFGSALQIMLYCSWALHYHVFICLNIPWAFAGYLLEDNDEPVNQACACCWAFCCCGLLFFLCLMVSPFATPFVVVYLINEVGGFYDEVQSWQAAYCIWGCSCGFLFYISLVVGDGFTNWLLWPFGIQAKKTSGTVAWLIPLVAAAISIVVGFCANYGLEKRYILDCDESYTEGICYGTLCCLPVSSHDLQEGTRFMGDLASNILAVWAVVKSIGYFICKHDDEMELEDQGQTQFMKYFSSMNMSKSMNRKQMEESIKSAEAGQV